MLSEQNYYILHYRSQCTINVYGILHELNRLFFLTKKLAFAANYLEIHELTRREIHKTFYSICLQSLICLQKI